jgi:polysaccharide pyruvyl transferase CsaB
MRILFSGYFGFGNTGDEAILAAELAAFHRLAPEAQLSVLSAAPVQTQTTYGVEAVPRMSWGAIRAEMARSQLFISGGGSLLQDVTSWRSPLYYLALLRMAQKRHLRTIAFCQGVGPLRRGWIRRLTAATLRRLDMIVVRDQDSAQLLEKLGIPASSIYCAADAVWLLEPTDAAEIQQAEGISTDVATLGLFLRALPGKTPAESAPLWSTLAADVDEFLRRHHAQAVFAPMQRPQDAAVGEMVMSRLSQPARQITGSYPPAALLGLTSAFSLVLGMRLHGLIFAARVGVPAVGLSYDPKVAAFCVQAGLLRPPSVDTLQPGEILTALETTWQQREALQVHLTDLCIRQQDKVLDAIRAALALVS